MSRIHSSVLCRIESTIGPKVHPPGTRRANHTLSFSESYLPRGSATVSEALILGRNLGDVPLQSADGFTHTLVSWYGAGACFERRGPQPIVAQSIADTPITRISTRICLRIKANSRRLTP